MSAKIGQLLGSSQKLKKIFQQFSATNHQNHPHRPPYTLPNSPHPSPLQPPHHLNFITNHQITIVKLKIPSRHSNHNTKSTTIPTTTTTNNKKCTPKKPPLKRPTTPRPRPPHHSAQPSAVHLPPNARPQPNPQNYYKPPPQRETFPPMGWAFHGPCLNNSMVLSIWNALHYKNQQ